MQFSNSKNPYFDPNDDYATVAFAIPDWMKSNCKDHESYKDANENYFLIKTEDSGDCLFHAIHLCLKSIMGNNAFTTYELRHAVAETVKESNDEKVKQVLQNWCAILKHANEEGDEQLVRDYAYAEPLLREQPSNGGEMTFSSAIRQQLFENMLNKSIYWGDQYAIMVLERLLNVKLLIVSKRPIGQKQYVASGNVGIEHDEKDAFDPKWYMILCLDTKRDHYMPVTKKKIKQVYHQGSNGQQVSAIEEYVAAFKKADLPEFITSLFFSLS